jgi:hypothetical protein
MIMEESKRNASLDCATVLALASGLTACALIGFAISSVGWRNAWWDGPAFPFCFLGVSLGSIGFGMGWKVQRPPLLRVASLVGLLAILAGMLTVVALALLLAAIDP